MVEENQDQTVELDETPVVEDVLPSEEDVQNEGYSPEEVEMAKRHNLLSEKKTDKETKKDEKSQEQPEKKKEEKEESKEDKKKELSKKFLDPNANLSSEEEYEGLKDFNTNERAMYWLRKKERRKRQEVEAERDTAKAKQEIYEKELRIAREEIEAARRNKPKEQAEGDPELDQLLDEEGKPKEQPSKDDKKYITQEELEKREKEQETQRQAKIEQAKKLNERLKEQETKIRTHYKDYKEVTDLAKEIIENPDEVFKDNPRTIAKIGAMVRLMYTTAGHALSEEQEYTAAEIFYEIGKLHPKNNGKQSQNANGDAQNADEKKGSAIDRMIVNSQKKGSSASVGSGGGIRNISVYDITPDEAVRLSDSEYAKLPAAVRERLLKA